MGLARCVFANNPGGHMAQLTWQDTTCVAPTCTFNVYRGTATGVCGTGKIPFITGITQQAYEDDSVLGGQTYYYAVTEWLQSGGEGACSAEAQNTVPSTQGGKVNGLQGQAH